MYAFRPAILSGLCCRLRQCLSAAILFSIVMGAASAASLSRAVRVDVFCIDECEVSSQRTIQINNESTEISDLQIYALGHILCMEAELSKDLGNKPDLSKRLALQRIHGMDEGTRAQIQRSAIGLSMTMQYGIDRVPAIVFDGKVIIYGITDLRAAAKHYRAWRVENEQ